MERNVPQPLKQIEPAKSEKTPAKILNSHDEEKPPLKMKFKLDFSKYTGVEKVKVHDDKKEKEKEKKHRHKGDRDREKSRHKDKHKDKHRDKDRDKDRKHHDKDRDKDRKHHNSNRHDREHKHNSERKQSSHHNSHKDKEKNQESKVINSGECIQTGQLSSMPLLGSNQNSQNHTETPTKKPQEYQNSTPSKSADASTPSADTPVKMMDTPVKSTDTPIKSTDTPIKSTDTPVKKHREKPIKIKIQKPQSTDVLGDILKDMNKCDLNI